MTIRPVTRCLAHDVLDGGPVTREFEEGSLHDRLPQAMAIAIRDISSGAAAVLPTAWLIVRRADGRILSDLGTHGPPDSEGCVEIGYSHAPSARGQGIGTAAVTAFVRRLAEELGIRRITAVTGAQNTASRRLLERQGFHLTDTLPDTDEVRYTEPQPVGQVIAGTCGSAPFGRSWSNVGKRARSRRSGRLSARRSGPAAAPGLDDLRDCAWLAELDGAR